MDFSKDPGKRGHIGADTLLLMMFLRPGSDADLFMSRT